MLLLDQGLQTLDGTLAVPDRQGTRCQLDQTGDGALLLDVVARRGGRVARLTIRRSPLRVPASVTRDLGGKQRG